ncbi:MAG: hypothetical protein COA78_04045 [Blastopirellula sp.]|nr:MAG: hypothetical protein COA78_04045 [Blastopirellula sp.]
MNAFEKISEHDFIFNELHFQATNSALSIYLSGDLEESHELEINFDPSPLCYRYTIEEIAIDKDEVEESSQVLEIVDDSEWLYSFQENNSVGSGGCKHYKVRIGNQMMDVISENEPDTKLVSEDLDEVMFALSGTY